jgi:predicted HicB family RNase H-like nuclease
MIEYKGYTGVFEFDTELELFSGFVVDLRDQIYFEGESVEQLKASMRRAIDHYLEVCAARGEEPEKPFSGRLNVRLGTDLHRAVAVAAAARGESINSWLIHVVSSAADQDPKVIPLTRRETRGGGTSKGKTPSSRKRSTRKAAGAPKS